MEGGGGGLMRCGTGDRAEGQEALADESVGGQRIPIPYLNVQLFVLHIL